MERVNCNRSLNRVIIINSSRERENVVDFSFLLSARDYLERLDTVSNVTPSELMTGKICAGTVVFSRPDILSRFVVSPVPRLIRPVCQRFRREGEGFRDGTIRLEPDKGFSKEGIARDLRDYRVTKGTHQHRRH